MQHLLKSFHILKIGNNLLCNSFWLNTLVLCFRAQLCNLIRQLGVFSRAAGEKKKLQPLYLPYQYILASVAWINITAELYHLLHQAHMAEMH